MHFPVEVKSLMDAGPDGSPDNFGNKYVYLRHGLHYYYLC